MSNSKFVEPYFDPHERISEIVVVGLGGTGSQVARSVARIVCDLRLRGKHAPRIKFIDGDVIEPKNCYRQMFLASETGAFKAETLARRFNFALGLDILWFNEPLDAEKHIPRQGALILDCVDNHLARREIARASGITISSGNGYQNGQVCIGSTSDLDVLMSSLETGARTGAYRHLPTVPLLFPELLEPERIPETPTMLPPEASCAMHVQEGSQSLLVNDLMGSIMAQYVYALLSGTRAVRTFLTFVDAEFLSMRSLSIHRDTLLSYLRIHQPA